MRLKTRLISQNVISLGMAAVVLAACLLSTFARPTPAQADPNKAKTAAIAATAGEAFLIYNYLQHKNGTNGVLALAGAGGTYYLWNQYSKEQARQKRIQAAERAYAVRRAAAYRHRWTVARSHKLAHRSHYRH